MFDDVYRVAKKPIKNWAQAQKLHASHAESEYFRILQSLTEEWIMSDSGLSPVARKSNIQKLLSINDAGRVAGINAALHSGLNIPLGIVPDYQSGWAWLLDARTSPTPSILWQAFFSKHEEIARHAQNTLASCSEVGLFRWLRDADISLTQEIINEWAILETNVQLLVWAHAVSLGRAMNLQKFDLSGAPWLQLVSKPPAPSSKEWKIITTATKDMVSQFLAHAPTKARLTAVEILLKSPKGQKMLGDLFINHQYPFLPVEAEREITLILSQITEKPAIFDQIVPALLQYASASYPWPSWFRIRCESDCCINWNKSPYKAHIGTWAELSLGSFPETARHDLFRSAKTSTERSHYNERWLKWYRIAPKEAGQWTHEIYWNELFNMPPTPEILPILLQADHSPMSIPSVVDVNPLGSLAILSNLDIPQDPQALDRYMPVSSLIASVSAAQQDLDLWRTSLLVALIRHSIANPTDIGAQLLMHLRQSLVNETQDAWAKFKTSMDDCLAKLSGLAKKSSALSRLVDEIVALRSAQPLASPIPDLEPTDDPNALGVDVRFLAIAQDEMIGHENQVIAAMLSPLEKMFDLDLGAYMNEVQTCLATLDVNWIAMEPGNEDFDPVRHEWVGSAPESHTKIRLQSPGLTRHSTVLIKAWGEPDDPRGSEA